MGKKDVGRAIANLPNKEYMQVMGFTTTEDNLSNTGTSFTNHEVYKYFKILREYALNRARWRSNIIPEEELRLIEWNIFHYGKCAMLRPKILNNNMKFEIKQPKIYRCAFTEVNNRNGKPNLISIVNGQNNLAIIENEYNFSEFVIFSDDFIFNNEVQPFKYVAWEFACKLHELDLAFNSNSHKLRMPFVFNNGGAETEKDGTLNILVNRGVSIAEIMRSAYGRNEQFVEIPQSMIGSNGFMHEPQFVDNNMLEHIEAQKKLYQAYFELLGFYTNKEKGGVYTVKDLQENGDETGDYIVEVYKNTRLLCAKKACEMFSIDLSLEMI